MEHGHWSTCPVCNGRGWDWFNTGAEMPTRATCTACGGLGVAEWVDEDIAGAAVRPCDTARFDAPYDALAA